MPRKPKIGRDTVFSAALKLVDREGLERFSMRRLGEALGVEAMSLYNHVPNKTAVLDGVHEAVLNEMRVPRLSGVWQQDILRLARAFRDVLRAHPNTLQLFATRPAVTPGSLAYVEQVLEILAGPFPDLNDRISALQSLVAFVVGHAMSQFSANAAQQTTPDYGALSSRAFPILSTVGPTLDRHSVDAEFDFGLDALVRGLDARAQR